MAQTPESKVKARVVAQLKLLGAYYFFPATGGYGRSGVPDIIGCFRGRFFAIECKAGRNKPTDLQLRELRRIDLSGGLGMVANEETADRVAAWLQKASHTTWDPSAEGVWADSADTARGTGNRATGADEP
jgi:hypothetical protein